MIKRSRKLYRVTLTEEERRHLQHRLDSGKGSASSRRRAQIMLLADEDRKGGGLTDADIANVIGVGTATVERVRRRCVLDGLDAALERKYQENRRTKVLDGEGEAKLVMLACSEPPSGYAEWTLRLLGDKMVDLAIVDSISTETIRRTLKKPNKALAKEVLVSSSEGE